MEDECVTVFSCDYCDFSCFCSETLLKHVKIIHKNNPRVTVYCCLCGRSFKKWNSLERHYRRDHPNGSYVEIDGCHVEETNELEEQNDEYNVDCMDIGDAVQCTDALWDTAYFLLRVTQEQSLTYSGIENFCDAMQDYKEMICSKISDQIGNNLKRYQGCVIDEINSKDILSAVEIDDNFSIFKSRYSREMYYEKHFNYNAPIPVCMGTERGWKLSKGGQLKLEEVEHYGYTIDFFSSLKALLENPDIKNEVTTPHKSTGDILRDFCDGTVYKNHPVFKSHNLALQIILYYDDIETANPLGSKAGNHKLGCFYYTIGNIRPMFRSNLRAIQLLAIAKTSDIRSYGCSKLLHEFIVQMNLLADDEGYKIQLNSNELLTIHGSVLCLLGDTLGSNFMGGFKESVGFSLRKCWRCLVTKEDMNQKFHAVDMINRDLKSHSEYLSLIASDRRTGWHSTTYGINGPSILSNLRHFDVTMCLPFDIMHSIFEGITIVHLNLLFCYLCDDLACLSLSQINHIIKSHPYGYSEVDTKPSLIDRESSTSSFHFKQSASQMMTLMSLLPYMIGNYIPKENEHWQCFLMLWDICRMVCAYQITSDDSLHLAWLVETYLESFTYLYGNTHITPKMHHLVHLPEQMMMFGPLRNQWCMRYESKNGQIKKFVSYSFKNVPLTVATYHQQWMCYYLALRPGQVFSHFLYAGDEISSGTMCEINEKEIISLLCGEISSAENIIALRANHIKIHGTRYAEGAIVRVKKPDIESEIDENKDFVYCCIVNIYIYKDFKIFEMERMNVLSFNEHLRAIEVGNTSHRLWCCYDDLFCNGVIHLLLNNGSMYIIDKQFWCVSD